MKKYTPIVPAALVAAVLASNANAQTYQAFSFTNYNFTLGGSQDFVVGILEDGVSDAIITVNTSTSSTNGTIEGAEFSNRINFSGYTTGESGFYSILTNFDSDFRVFTDSIFARGGFNGQRAEMASVTGIAGDTITGASLTVADATQFDGTNGDTLPVPTYSAITNGLSFTPVFANDDPRAGTNGTYTGASFDVDGAGQGFTYTYERLGGGILSEASNFSYTTDAITSTVPEPSSALLLGLGGLGFLARRKRA